MVLTSGEIVNANVTENPDLQVVLEGVYIISVLSLASISLRSSKGGSKASVCKYYFALS